MLTHVYWIGGSPGAGKSTIARRLTAGCGLHLYDTDEAMADHARRSTPEDSPELARFAAMDMDERWLDRSPQTMLDTFHWFRGEGFPLIVEDLRALPPVPPVVAEGFRLLPHLVRPVAAPGRAVWLLPSADFREAAFARRGSTWKIPGRTSDPPRARRNLLERDRMFDERIRAEVERLGLPAIEVTTGVTEAGLTARVAEIFGLTGCAGSP